MPRNSRKTVFQQTMAKHFPMKLENLTPKLKLQIATIEISNFWGKTISGKKPNL
jgi:hypothetical protein